jgi:uncharacterized membrane protein YccC
MAAGMAWAKPAAAGLPPLIAPDLRALNIAEGIRAALATAIIVALNEWLNWPPLMEAAMAALLTCQCDAGGQLRRRLPAILCFGIAGAILTVAFSLLRSTPLPVVVPLACVAIFCNAFIRIYGQAAMQVGNLLTVVIALALARPIGGVVEALTLGGMFLAGSAWALLLTMVIWRLHPYLPARRAVANVYEALANLCGDLRLVMQHPDPHETIWDRHARAHRRDVRAAIENARQAVMETVRVRGPISSRAAQSWIRLAAAEQMFGALIALSDLLGDTPDAETHAAADRILRLLRPMLLLLARFAVTDAPERLARLERAVAGIEAVADKLPDSPLHRIVDTLVGRLRIAITLAAPEGIVPGTPPGPGPVGRRQIILEPLRANLSTGSEAMRHAARAALIAAPAFAFTLHWPTTYGHWLTIMLVLTMQPYFALTFARALERILGTAVGGLVAAALAIVCTTPLSIAFAMFPLAVIALSVRTVSFGLFMACLTPMIVLLSELGEPGASELTIALMRALYTVIGSALAVLGCLLLWPNWEPGRLARELRAAIAAHGRYARVEISALIGEGTPQDVEQARREAGMASNNAEASLQRALMEPRRDRDGRLEAALTVDAALRRIAGRLSALQVDGANASHDAAAWRPWRDWIDAGTATLTRGGGALPPRPKLPPGDQHALALARIAGQLELAAGALQRLGNS